MLEIQESYFDLNVEERSKVRRDVRDFILTSGLSISKEILEEILGEVLQNINKHAYKNSGGPIYIKILKDEEKYIVYCKDFGCGKTDIENQYEENYDFLLNSSGHGMGLNIINLMLGKENFRINSDENKGTCVMMIFDPETSPAMSACM